VGSSVRPTMSGELRHIGNLEVRTLGLDQSGTPNQGFVLWAENINFAIDDWKSPETMVAQQVEGTQTTRIRIRYRPGVQSGMRLVYRTNPGESPAAFEYYEIMGVTRDITLRVEIQLNCILRDVAGFRVGQTP
jgi:head-tail adaptor